MNKKPFIGSGIWRAIRAAAVNLWRGLRRYPAVVVFLTIYAMVRIGGNLLLGASLWTALRSLLIGLFSYGLMVIVVDAIHVFRLGTFHDLSIENTIWVRRNTLALTLILGLWVFWALNIIDSLQRGGAILGKPVLAGLPGWEMMLTWLDKIGEWLHALYTPIPAAIFANRLQNLLWRVLLPLALMMILGYQWKDFSLTFRNGIIMAPFLLIGSLMMLINTPTLTTIIFLGLTCIYPGLSEELMYRGLIQRLLTPWLQPGNALLVTAIMFGLLHLPSFWFEVYPHPLMAVINVFDVALTGLVWGYAFQRMGSLLPLAVYHAVADVAGM